MLISDVFCKRAAEC